MCLYDDYLVSTDLVEEARRRVISLTRELETASKCLGVLNRLSKAMRDHRQALSYREDLIGQMSPWERRLLDISK